MVGLNASPADVDVFEVREPSVNHLRPGSLTPMTGMKGTTPRPGWADAVAAEYGQYFLLATTMDAATAATKDLLLSSWCVLAPVLATPGTDTSVWN